MITQQSKGATEPPLFAETVHFAFLPFRPLHTKVLNTSAVVDTTLVDTKNIPTCRYNIQHIDKRTMENKMSIIM